MNSHICTEACFKAHEIVGGTYYHVETPAGLIALLERVRQDRTQRVLIILGDTATGIPWEEEPERGYIGRSIGPHKMPLLIKTNRSLGGGTVLDHCILQVRESRGGKVLWTHPSYRALLAKRAEVQVERAGEQNLQGRI